MINVITISVIIKTVIATIVRGSCYIVVQRLDSWTHWVRVLLLPLRSCVTLGKSLHLSGPWFPHL